MFERAEFPLRKSPCLGVCDIVVMSVCYVTAAGLGGLWVVKFILFLFVMLLCLICIFPTAGHPLRRLASQVTLRTQPLDLHLRRLMSTSCVEVRRLDAWYFWP